MAKTRKRRSMRSGMKKAMSGGAKHLNIPGGIPQYIPEADTTDVLDFIPYIVPNPKKHPDSEAILDDIWWRYPYKLHRNIGPDNKTLICPTTLGKSCPLCEKRQEIYDDPDIDDETAKKMIRDGSLKASKRCLYVVIPKASKKYKEIPHIFDFSEFCFHDKLKTELDHGDEELQCFADLEDGYSLKVRFIEEAIGTTKFPVADRIDFNKRNDYDEDILDNAPVLDTCLMKVLTYKQIENINEGIEDDIDDEKVMQNTRKKEEPEAQNEQEEPKRKKKSALPPKEPEAQKEQEKEVPPEKEVSEDTQCPKGSPLGEMFEDYEECKDCLLYDACLDAA